MKLGTIVTTIAAAALCAGTIHAAPTDDPGIRQRELNQERRIDQGVRSGELTPREAGKLERQQEKIRRDEARMKSDGKLTPAERRKLTREQNRASKKIFRKKHNARKVEVQ